MTSQLHSLPGAQVGKNLPAGFLQLFFDKLDFLLKADAERVLFGMGPQFIKFVLQFDDRFFEIELMSHKRLKV